MSFSDLTLYLSKHPTYLSHQKTASMDTGCLGGAAVFINKVLWTSCFHFTTEISHNRCSKLGKSTDISNKVTTISWCKNASILRIIHLKLLLGRICQLKGDLGNYTVVNGTENGPPCYLFLCSKLTLLDHPRQMACYTYDLTCFSWCSDPSTRKRAKR